ncbi:hypothetical protein [Streptomyces olivaceus]|uniref:hypothetical protein n=1 Tax=Streptomyces olivaceus TaxID=47716 RepID=UPI001CCD1FE7|nr:hypothetical protein [Streptomyces olivaceus]
MSGWWTCLEERACQEADENVLRDRRPTAVKAVWEALRPLGVGVHEAEQVVHARYEALGDRVRHSPPAPQPLQAVWLLLRLCGTVTPSTTGSWCWSRCWTTRLGTAI